MHLSGVLKSMKGYILQSNSFDMLNGMKRILTCILVFCLVRMPVSAQHFFICFTNDLNHKLALSVGFNAKTEKAVFVKYKGQADTIPLSYVKQIFPHKGYATYETTYNEKYLGKQTGTYVFTHSGNWDYIKYIRKKDHKTFNFTIDLDTSMEGKGYRKTPCY